MTAKISGKYVAAFVQSAGEVSAVFEKKAQETLASHGIEEPDPEGYYDDAEFGAALAEIEEKAGERTVRRAGQKMIAVNEPIVSQSSAVAGLETMAEQHAGIHRDYSVAEAGGYDVLSTSDDSCRVDVLGDYPFPLSLPHGAIEGTVQQTESEATRVTVDRVDAPDDVFARFEVGW
ncbi:hypothetical protein RYH80_14825 [Halobaculum sp. MBLA0147]|uniref:hypothetical protein n=1 Tax=Halobaculum sp. MBLA0147 TaxID=3079934 RepID=UPI003526B3CC